MFEIKKELLPTHEALLEVTFDEEAVAQAMREAARVISRQVNIPGFPEGLAPQDSIATILKIMRRMDRASPPLQIFIRSTTIVEPNILVWALM